MKYKKPATVWLLLAGFCMGPMVSADYIAYSVGKKSKAPFPEHVADVESKYMLVVEWGDYRGRKSILTVLPVSNNSTANSAVAANAGEISDFSSALTAVPIDGIGTIVSDALERTGRFNLLAASDNSVTTEAVSPVTSDAPATAPAVESESEVRAEFLLQVVVTDYQIDAEEKQGEKGKVRGKIPFLGGPKGGSWVGLNIRLIDTASNEVTFTKQVEGIIRDDDLNIDMDTFSGDSASVEFMSAYSRSPIGQAVFAAVNEGIFELIKHVGNRSPEGSIVKADSDQIYTNLGSDMVSIGDLLQVVRGGDELFDPDTGISLGGSVTPVGVIEVTYAEDKFSVARPVSLSGPVDRGDRVVATKSTEPLEFAKKWKKPK